ncbi:MAG: response regulator, partial [Nitrospinaceae bacterium]|nr:response regulator [Nitrospinaceae bacterium]
SFLKTLEKLLDRRIVTKSEEKERHQIFVDKFKSSVDEVKNLRGDGKTEEAEVAFVDTLKMFFLTSAAMHDAREDHDKSARIVREGKIVFPRLENEFLNFIGEASATTAAEQTGATNNDLAEKIDPKIAILVADSNSNSLAIYREFFKELQLSNVSFTSDGLSTLREDDANIFELIFLNYQLSDMSGQKVLAAIRVGETNPDVPVIMTYGSKDRAAANESLRSGATAAVERPTKVEHLKEAIESLLNKRIQSKSEIQNISAQCLDIVSKSIGAVFVMKKAGIYKGPDAPFVDFLLELMMTMMEVYLARGDKKSAEALVEQGRNIFPDIGGRFSERTDESVTRGTKLLEEKLYSQAKSEFKTALTLNEFSIEAFIGLGESCHFLGDAEGAKEAFQQAISSPESSAKMKLLMQLGLLTCRYEYYETALEAYDQLISTYQLDPRLFYNKALIHVRKREFGKALPLLSRAISLDEEYSPAKTLHKKVRGWMSQIPDVELQPQ